MEWNEREQVKGRDIGERSERGRDKEQKKKEMMGMTRDRSKEKC